MEGEYIPKETNIEKKEENKKTDRLSGVLRQSLLSDLITLATGLFVYFGSSFINQVIGIVVGSFILFIGLVNIYKCHKSNEINITSKNFLLSILVTAVGIFVICSPLIVTQALTIMLGIILFIIGVNKLIYAFLLKKQAFKIWLFSLILGILLAIFGITMLINPFSNILITKIIGIVLIMIAVIDLINLFIIKKESKAIIELHW
jgi:uncharacterized membrane protein HdeD (DUF308 family)